MTHYAMVGWNAARGTVWCLAVSDDWQAAYSAALRLDPNAAICDIEVHPKVAEDWAACVSKGWFDCAEFFPFDRKIVDCLRKGPPLDLAKLAPFDTRIR